jgi:cell division protein FtsW
VSAAAADPPRRERATRREETGGIEYGVLALVSLALVAFGLVMVYSATSGRAVVGQGDPMEFLVRQAVFAGLGLAALVLLSRFDFRRLRYLAPPLLAAAAFLLVLVLVAGNEVNGARRWLGTGGLALQPSELAKLALALWVAWVLGRSAPRTLGELVRPVGLVTAAACFLVLLEPDLGTAVTIAVMVFAILLVAGTPVGVLASAGSIALALALVAAWIEPYRRARLLSFLDPWADPQGAGFQTVQAMIALGSGGPFGVGLGESVQKIYYLPEASTDMIFAVIGEELGFVGAVAVIGAFVAFGWAGFSVALRCRDPFGKRLAAGLTAMVLGQAALNLAAVMGIAPLTGVPLPFVSYGGSSLLVTLASVGILLNIASNDAADVATAQVPDRRRRNGRARPAGDRGGRVARGERGRRHVRGVA